MQLVDTSDSEDDEKGKKTLKLAGSRNADKGERKGKLVAEVFDVTFSPTGQLFFFSCPYPLYVAGRSFTVCSTEGVQVYSLDSTHSFDPFHLHLSTSAEEIEK